MTTHPFVPARIVEALLCIAILSPQLPALAEIERPAQVPVASTTVARNAAGDSLEQPGPLAHDLSSAWNARAIHKAMRKVADWQLAYSEPKFNQQWTYAALYDGLLAARTRFMMPSIRPPFST